MAKQQRNDRPIEHYVVESLPNGFKVSHPLRRTVHVGLGDDNMWKIHWDERWSTRYVDALNFPKLIENIADAVMHDWKSPVPIGKQKWWGVRDWTKARVARALNPRVHKIWLDTIEHRYEPWQLGLMRRVFNVTFRHIPKHLLEQFFNDHPRDATNYLVEDIMQHRAAAHALILFNRQSSGSYIPWGEFNWRSQFDSWFNVDHKLPTGRWKTLMALPHPFSNRILYYYKYIPSPRPIYTKRQLAWACAMAEMCSTRHVPRSWAHFPLYTNDEDLGRAVATIDRYLNRQEPEAIMIGQHKILNLNSCKSYREIAALVSDGFMIDETYMRGCTTVNALVKRSIQVHRDGLMRRHETIMRQRGYTPNTETAKPPIELLDQLYKGGTVKFLATAGEVVKEGSDMGHCVSGYVSYAVDGISFLFHVYYKEEHATIEVGSDGRVRGASGPHNNRNEAANWGRRELGKWGRRFPHDPTAVQDKHWLDQPGQPVREGGPGGQLDVVNYAALPMARVEIAEDGEAPELWTLVERQVHEGPIPF